EPEAEEDALLHPRVDAPARWRRGIRFCGADVAGRQRLAQPRKGFARLLAVRGRALSDELVDVVFEHVGDARLKPRAHRVGWSAHALVEREALAERSHTSAVFNRSSCFSTARIFSFDAGRGASIGSR